MELYYGVIEDIFDPKKLGRVKVRIVNVHSKDRNDIPIADLPWSIVMAGTTTPGISGLGNSVFLVQGAWVVGVFTDQDMQSFMVMGTLPSMSSEVAPTPSFGFTDPTSQYPRNESEEDNNLRARGRPDPNDYEIQGEYQPRSAYAPLYPYNHVYESESGHIKEYDDTPGANRIRERHNSGTYYEVQPGGSKVQRVVADKYELILGDDTIEVKGNVNIIVSQDVNLSVAGSVTANVGENVDFLVHGDVNGEVRGNIAMRVGANLPDHVTYDDQGVAIHHPTVPGYSKDEAVTYFSNDTTVAFDINKLTLADAIWTYDGESIPARNGNVDLHIEGSLTGLVDQHVNLTVLQDAKVDVKGDVDLDVGGNMDTLVKGTYRCESEGNMTFVAPHIDIN